MTLAELPGWAVDEPTSIRQEVEHLIDLSEEERWEATRAACRAAMRWLTYHEHPKRALEWRDPMSDSTARTLARLREKLREPRPRAIVGLYA